MVGAGPVGLTAARRLADGGIPVVVLEASQDLDKRLRASTFHPPTLDMLEQLAASQPLIARGLPTREWQIRMQGTGDRVVFDLGLLADHTRHPFRLQVEQHQLCEILLSQLKAQGNTDVLFGHRVTALHQDEEHVQISWESARRKGELAARYLIGADGASSAIREMLGVDFTGMTYNAASVLVTTDFPFHEHMEGLSNVTYFWGLDQPFSLLRLRDVWRASLYPPQGCSLEDLMEHRQLCAQLNKIIHRDDDWNILAKNPYRVHARVASTFRKGRVVLAGDAAHLNPPSGGMGMNGGIHDAFNLTEKLIQVWHGADASLLDLYDRQRRTVVAEETIPDAQQNRERMHTNNRGNQARELARLQEIAADPALALPHLLRSSMFSALDRAAAIT